MDKNRRENSLFSCLFLYRSGKTDCFPVCYTKIDRKTDWLAMGIFPALFLSKTWPYNGFLEPCFLALRLGKYFFHFAQWGQFSFSKPLCSTNVIVFYLAYLALAGLMNLLAQLSDRIIHFGEYNLMPLAFLTKLSIMHWILCTKMDYPIW